MSNAHHVACRTCFPNHYMSHDHAVTDDRGIRPRWRSDDIPELRRIIDALQDGHHGLLSSTRDDVSHVGHELVIIDEYQVVWPTSDACDGEHDWPADLGEDGAACERCGLPYDEWSE